jgi:hypothetical protein
MSLASGISCLGLVLEGIQSDLFYEVVYVIQNLLGTKFESRVLESRLITSVLSGRKSALPPPLSLFLSRTHTQNNLDNLTSVPKI